MFALFVYELKMPENSLHPQIHALIAQGENQATEFKNEQVRPESLAKELVAFSNTMGGNVIIGVEDDGEVSGIHRKDMIEWVTNIARNNLVPGINPKIELYELESKRVLLVSVPKGPHKPYQTIDGKFWIRVGSTNRQATKEELSRLFQQAGLMHFDISPVEGANHSFLDNDLLHKYWSTYYSIPYLELDSDEQHTILNNSDILVPFADKEVCSVGGLLIFGKLPQRRLPQASIVFALFKGTQLTDELLDKKELTGTLPKLIQDTENLIKLFIPVPSKVEGLIREEQIRIPTKVIREALVNAVCHRDYSLINRKTTVYLFSDRIEITSPGRIGNSLTLEKIKTGNSAPRNHLILKFLDNMRFIDGLGRGVPLMIRLMENRIHLEEIGELFRVTLYLEENIIK